MEDDPEFESRVRTTERERKKKLCVFVVLKISHRPNQSPNFQKFVTKFGTLQRIASRIESKESINDEKQSSQYTRLVPVLFRTVFERSVIWEPTDWERNQERHTNTSRTKISTPTNLSR